MQRTKLKCYGVLRDDVSRLAEFHGGLILPFGGDDFGTPLTLGLRFLCHRALHIFRQFNVFNLDRRYLGSPWFGMLVDDVFYLLVDARGVREQLIEAEAADNITHGGLANLAGSRGC